MSSYCASDCVQVQEYLTRFESIPDMLELDHLTMSGDVTMGKNVSLKVKQTDKNLLYPDQSTTR